MGGTRRGGVGWSGHATARDVAALAGVSAQTVSRVANGAENVRPETRARVLDAMGKLGYTPNAAARALRSGRSGTLGVVVHHLARTGAAHVVQAVTTTAHARGYGVILVDASGPAITDLNETIVRLRQEVAGLVVLGQAAAGLDLSRAISRTPAVSTAAAGSPFPSVGFDHGGGAALAVTHLLELGHHTVHLVAGPASSPQAQQREQAWRATLQAAGRPVPPPARGDWTPASGYRLGREIAADADVTAVFAANDEMATGLMRALHEAGRRLPHDVSVVGFDDVFADYLWPPLTTVRQDFAALGENLVRLLLRQVDPDAVAGETVTALVPARLVVRASSGPRRNERPAR